MDNAETKALVRSPGHRGFGGEAARECEYASSVADPRLTAKKEQGGTGVQDQASAAAPTRAQARQGAGTKSAAADPTVPGNLADTGSVSRQTASKLPSIFTSCRCSRQVGSRSGFAIVTQRPLYTDATLTQSTTIGVEKSTRVHQWGADAFLLQKMGHPPRRPRWQ